MTRFDCPVCGEEHRTAGAVHDHAWTVHGACHYCGETFDDEATLYVHWLATHDGELSRVDRKRAKADIDELTVGDRLVHHGPGTAVTGLSRRTLLLAGGAAIAGGATAVGTTLSGEMYAAMIASGEMQSRPSAVGKFIPQNWCLYSAA